MISSPTWWLPQGHMRRRVFISALAGAAIWSLKGRARLVGVLVPFGAQDPEVRTFFPAFKQRLQELGWFDGRNIRFEYRFTGNDGDRIRGEAAELIGLAPDAIFVWSNLALAVLRQATQTIPIVFALVSDPVGAGFVSNLARPGGNITGFQNFEAAIGGKWLELIKEIAPAVRRAAVVYHSGIAANTAFLQAAEVASGALSITVTAIDVRDIGNVERAITAFAEPNGALILAPNPVLDRSRDQIIALAADLRLPAIYPFRIFPARGGLVSYGLNPIEQQRGAAAYVDCILRGAKPGDLPVQLPTKYELVINLKTARALGLTIPPSLLALATNVIE